MMQCMLLTWLKARDAVDAGSDLADAFPTQTTGEFLRPFIQQATQDLSGRKLNFYKRVRFANSFKWRLLEKGVPAETAHDVTQTLLINTSVKLPALSTPGATAAREAIAAPGASGVRAAINPNAAATAKAAKTSRVPKDSAELNELGVTLCKEGRYQEAKKQFHNALARNPKNADALCNLGSLYATQARFADAENHYRRALRLKPADPLIRASLGHALANQGLLDKSREELEKVLKTSPRFAPALTGMGTLERAAGRFTEAEQLYRRALESDPTLVAARAGMANVRRMTTADSQWLADTETAASNTTSPADEADLRFAIGKYYDDVADYARAFKSYQRANELLKARAQPFDERVYSRFIDDLTRVYTPAVLTDARASGSSSTRPVFVVGMPRSGTSLVEQILASHPGVGGAGELDFWSDLVSGDEARIRKEILSPQQRQKIASAYLQALQSRQRDAGYVVDKTPRNADYLGLIHSVFPDARIVYVQRDPIDTCLSCYFQQFPANLNFTMDLSDLAHYYQEHQRLMAHWRAVLPPGTILDVPYAELVADQEGWTRRILEFVGLEWDPRCLDFHSTKRAVVTASYWQVRQRIYKDSVQRWRNYRKFIGPLLDLKEG